MSENESDSGDGWPEPRDRIGPWAARDEDEAGQDTTAFGSLAGQAGGPGQPSPLSFSLSLIFLALDQTRVRPDRRGRRLPGLCRPGSAAR